MQWHDFDKDKGVRYDYDDNVAVGYDSCCNFANGTYLGNVGNIGHPIHRYLHPELYVTYDSLFKQYPQLTRDTDTTVSKNGRITLMKKKCRDLVDSFTITAPMTTTLKNTLKTNVCSVYSTVLRSTARKPARSDWVGGTPGVDEEVLDGFDNDYDGIADEDSRNMEGFDDDGDGAMAESLITVGVKPMQWKDHNHNGCIDIDTTRSSYSMGSADSLARQFCIGTLENRLYLARQGMRFSSPSLPHSADSLYTYYSSFGLINNNCKDQFNKRLDPAFRAKFNPSTDEGNLACQFQHVWIAPRPPNSEWTGGVLGVDEEICGDRIDNDGDGWIDEDCGAKGSHTEGGF
jgi:hypothetical protein